MTATKQQKSQRKTDWTFFQHKESDLFQMMSLDYRIVAEALDHCYRILDIIDEQLIVNDSPRLAGIIELANLSSIVGNLLASGIALASEGKFQKNKPHTFPDLIPSIPNLKPVEIKVALEKNKPKGHLSKAGHYLTFRYILGNGEGNYVKGKNCRGDVVWIWEIRAGILDITDFDVSSTSGDSGQTANIKTNAFFNKMKLHFFVPSFSPYSGKNRSLF